MEARHTTKRKVLGVERRTITVASFRPESLVKRFLEEYCCTENRSVANALETLIISSPDFQEWCKRNANVAS